MSFRGRPQASTSRLPEAPPVVSTARKLRKRPSSKGKERAPAAEATVEEKGDSADEWKPPSDDEQHRRNKGKRKASAKRAGKRVRIASPSSDDSDQQQEDFVSLSPSPTATGRRRLRGADESSDDDGELNPDHYWDPRVLPMNGAQRRTRELRKLEYGLYRSALYDAATNETDLGRILLEWEALKRRRRVEEQEQQEQEQGPGGTRVEQLARARRSTRSQSGTPAPLTDREDTPSTPFASLDDPDTLPFPSAFSLDLLSRWPLNPATLDTPSTITQPISDSLWSLVSSTAHQLERLNPALRPPPRRRARVRSAYETNAPLALPSTLAYTGAPTTNGSAGGHDDLEDSESSSDSDDLGSGDDDLDSLAPTPAQTSTFGHLSTSLDSLLMSLVDKIPAGPPPPLDFYTQQKIKASQPRERVLGWETVLEVVKGMEGVPER
ncbi:hypothetical protein BCR35DRAFT_69748 [Leucosporidium creatinivorum]|uniref:Uncharacterized protein n=1 Tax=Leucosporidium creatinivorum TaxID=106004 RepID=A0A1Y2G2F6_9BASI|nr:hypothetical protein BCR35DRAFT_69748 [Leucosporidium creatinivorum]